MTVIQETRRKGWCPGALRPMETGDGLLVRVRPRTGSFSTDQLNVLAETAETFGSGEIDLTNRANLQLRELNAATLPDALDALAAAGLIDESAAIEAVRNVMVDPLSGLDPDRCDVRWLARELEQTLASNTALHALPGKFGFSLSGAPLPLQSAASSDISIAMPSPAVCAITLDGDASRAAAVASSDAPAALEKLALAFLAIQARKDTVRRMRDAVAALGTDAVFAMAGLNAAPATHPAPASKASQRTGLLGPAMRPFAVSFGLPFGRIDARSLKALCTHAVRTGCIEVRPSGQRTLVLPVTEDADFQSLAVLAETLDLIIHDGDPRLRMDVCPGAPSCRNATTSTRRDAQRLIEAFAASGHAMPQVHISGCEKGCARRSSADLTLVARNGVYDVIAHGTVAGAAILTNLSPETMAPAVARYAAGGAR